MFDYVMCACELITFTVYISLNEKKTINTLNIKLERTSSVSEKINGFRFSLDR